MLDRNDIIQLQQGAEEAYKKLVLKWKAKFIRHFSVNYRMNLEDAEDAWQDLCEKLIKNITKFSPDNGEHIFRWLIQVADRLAIDQYRRKKKSEKFMSTISDKTSSSVIYSEETNISQAAQKLRKFIFSGNLSREDIALIKLFFAVGFSYRDIAEEMGIPISTVKAKIRRIKVRMLEHLSEEEKVNNDMQS